MKLKKSDRSRAAYAFEKVKEIKAKFEKEKNNKKESKLFDEYESHVKSFPIMILQNGLGNAAAFAYAKSKKDDNGNYNAWAYLLWHLINYPG
jgi:CRISPR-associated protein Cmr5